MNLIVIDLEWNTASRSQKVDADLAAKMMFEIIEIGAVKMTDDLSVGEQFHRYVTPVLYKKIQFHIAAVTKRTQQSLRDGVVFSQAAEEFSQFAGENPILVSWGSADPEVYISNCQFHDKAGGFRFQALNAQSVFSGLAEGATSGEQRSVEYALDFLRLPKDLPFHKAISDAIYAARILSRTLEFELAERPEETIESLLKPYLYDPFLTRQHETVVEIDKSLDVMSYLEHYDFVCPACRKRAVLLPTNEGKNWHLVKSNKVWFAAARCEEHGDIEVLVKKARRSRRPLYVIKTRIPDGPLKIPEPQKEDKQIIWVDPDA